MTIDERLEALRTRHEALAQTVELIASLRKDADEEQKARNVYLDKLHADMMLALARLSNTAD